MMNNFKLYPNMMMRKKVKSFDFHTFYASTRYQHTPSILVKALSRVIHFFFNHIYVHTTKEKLIKLLFLYQKGKHEKKAEMMKDNPNKS